MGEQHLVRLVEGGDVRVTREGGKPRGGDLPGRPPGAVVHLVRFADADETRHPPGAQGVRDGSPSTWADRQAASSAAGSFLSSVHVRSGSGKR